MFKTISFQAAKWDDDVTWRGSYIIIFYFFPSPQLPPVLIPLSLSLNLPTKETSAEERGITVEQLYYPYNFEFPCRLIADFKSQ